MSSSAGPAPVIPPVGPGPNPPFDWKGNPEAKANREAKAEAIFRYCWEQNLDPMVMVNPRDRNRIAREAGGVRVMPDGKRKPLYSSVSDETWQLAVAKHQREHDRTWLARALRRV